jgi:hypothetical protein
VAKPLRRLPLGRPSPSWRGRADHRRGGRHSGQDQPCERAAEAAHELRTPLAILAARIDSLPPGDQVAGMRRDIKRMRAMVDQLLMVARLEASAARSEDLVDLVDLTRDVVADCSPLALAQDRQLALAPIATRSWFAATRACCTAPCATWSKTPFAPNRPAAGSTSRSGPSQLFA